MFDNGRRSEKVITFVPMSMTVLLRCQVPNQVPARAVHSESSCHTLKGGARKIGDVKEICGLSVETLDRITFLHQSSVVPNRADETGTSVLWFLPQSRSRRTGVLF